MSLAELQHRFRDAIVTGDAGRVAFLLVGGIDPRARLAIHQRHYEASLVRAILDRCPASQWLVGSEPVIDAAREFIRRHPPIAPDLPARMAMMQELTLPILLFLGLGTRIATLPLLGMIGVIQVLVYPNAWVEHLVWASILLFLLMRGPGVLSPDHLMAKRFGGEARVTDPGLPGLTK